MKTVNEKWGGKENFLNVFRAHYKKLFADPLMKSLFDMRSKDSNV